MVGRGLDIPTRTGKKHGGPSYRIARAEHIAHADPMPPEVDIPHEAAPALLTKLRSHVCCASHVAVVVAHLGAKSTNQNGADGGVDSYKCTIRYNSTVLIVVLIVSIDTTILLIVSILRCTLILY